VSNQRNEQLSQLYRAVLSLRSEEECRAFLEDLCTIQEVEDMRKRLEVARLLDGGVNYQEIGQQTGMSTATISRVKPGHPLATRCQELGLNFVVGNSHALEIFENGLPLAKALAKLLPATEVLMFRDRVTATPLAKFGTQAVQDYADMIVENYLVKE
jgi:TrpR-related protein YerC/YecD